MGSNMERKRRAPIGKRKTRPLTEKQVKDAIEIGLRKARKIQKEIKGD